MRGHRFALLAFVLAAVVAVVVRSFTDGAGLCAQLDVVVDDAPSGFADHRGERIADGIDEWTSIVAFDGATHCEIVEDLTSSRLGCTWERPIGETEDARADYAAMVDDVRACLGDGIAETGDASVNHPDSYESVLFEPEGDPAVSVAIKQKSQLGTVLVTVGVSIPADLG